MINVVMMIVMMMVMMVDVGHDGGGNWACFVKLE